MGYPEDALAVDERLILHRHPHWKVLILPVLTLMAATAVAGVAAGFAQSRLQEDGAERTAALVTIGVLWLIIVVWRFAIPLLSWRTTHFIVTDRRVLIRDGIITHSGIDIPMNRISNVQFRHGPIDRLLRTGTLILGSASEDPLELDDIPNVTRVHALLYNEVFGTPGDGTARQSPY